MERWEVETEDKVPTGRRARYKPKGNTFTCGGIGVLSPRVGYGEVTRPLWASFVCEDGATSPIVANIRMGRKVSRYRGAASSPEAVMEFLRSVPYEVKVQRLSDGLSSVVVFRPEFFQVNPGPVEVGAPVSYVVLPDDACAARLHLTDRDVRRAWESARNVPLPGDAEDFIPLERYEDETDRSYRERTEYAKRYRVERLARLYPPMPEEPDTGLVLQAVLSGAYLDHRTHCPLLPDTGFLVYLLRVMRAHDLAHLAGERDEDRWHRASETWHVEEGHGYMTPLVVSGTSEAFEAAVAQAVREYIPNE